TTIGAAVQPLMRARVSTRSSIGASSYSMPCFASSPFTSLHWVHRGFVYTVTVIVYIPFNKRRAAAACCGTTPLPIALICCALERPGTTVTHPSRQHIIHTAHH